MNFLPLAPTSPHRICSQNFSQSLKLDMEILLDAIEEEECEELKA
jgi:hypothetical protein